MSYRVAPVPWQDATSKGRAIDIEQWIFSTHALIIAHLESCYRSCNCAGGFQPCSRSSRHRPYSRRAGLDASNRIRRPMRLLPTTANAIQRINLRWTILCGVAINVRFELLASCAQALGQFTHEAIARFVATLSARPQLRRITYKMVCLDIAYDGFVATSAAPRHCGHHVQIRLSCVRRFPTSGYRLHRRKAAHCKSLYLHCQ